MRAKCQIEQMGETGDATTFTHLRRAPFIPPPVNEILGKRSQHKRARSVEEGKLTLMVSIMYNALRTALLRGWNVSVQVTVSLKVVSGVVK